MTKRVENKRKKGIKEDTEKKQRKTHYHKKSQRRGNLGKSEMK